MLAGYDLGGHQSYTRGQTDSKIIPSPLEVYCIPPEVNKQNMIINSESYHQIFFIYF